MENNVRSFIGKKVCDVEADDIFRGMTIPKPELIGDECYIELPSIGMSLVLPDGATIAAVHLHSHGHENYSGYRGNIPAGIRFDMSRDQIRELMGAPARSGDGGRVVFLGNRPAWDAYDLDRETIHVEYADDKKRIVLITISAAQK